MDMWLSRSSAQAISGNLKGLNRRRMFVKRSVLDKRRARWKVGVGDRERDGRERALTYYEFRQLKEVSATVE